MNIPRLSCPPPSQPIDHKDRPLDQILLDPHTDWTDIRNAIKSQGGGACTNMAIIGAVNPSRRRSSTHSALSDPLAVAAQVDELNLSLRSAGNSQNGGNGGNRRDNGGDGGDGGDEGHVGVHEAQVGGCSGSGGGGGKLASSEMKLMRKSTNTSTSNTECSDDWFDNDGFDDAAALEDTLKKLNQLSARYPSDQEGLPETKVLRQDSINVMDFGVDHMRRAVDSDFSDDENDAKKEEVYDDGDLSKLVGSDGFMGWDASEIHKSTSGEGGDAQVPALYVPGYNPVSKKKCDEIKSEEGGDVLCPKHENDDDSSCCNSVDSFGWSNRRSDSLEARDCNPPPSDILAENLDEPPGTNQTDLEFANPRNSNRRATWNIEDYDGPDETYVVRNSINSSVSSPPPAMSRVSSAGTFIARQFRRISDLTCEEAPSRNTSWTLYSDDRQSIGSVKTHDVKRALLRVSLNQDKSQQDCNQIASKVLAPSAGSTSSPNSGRGRCRSLYSSFTSNYVPGSGSGAAAAHPSQNDLDISNNSGRVFRINRQDNDVDIGELQRDLLRKSTMGDGQGNEGFTRKGRNRNGLFNSFTSLS